MKIISLTSSSWQSVSVQTAGGLSVQTAGSLSVQTAGIQFKHLTVCLSANIWDSNPAQTTGNLFQCNTYHSDSMQTAGNQTQFIQPVLWLNALIQARQVTFVLLHYKGIHKYVFTCKAWGSHSGTIDNANSSQILCCVEWLVVTNILQNQTAFIFRTKQYKKHDGPSKCQ